MRPEPVRDRAFFRPEAEEYRRLRNLGDIILLRPLSLRLVTWVPVLIVALLVLALSRLEYRSMFVALAEQPSASLEALRLSLAPGAAEPLRRGDEIEWRIAGTAERSRGVITELATGPCSREARAFSRTSAPECLQVTISTPLTGRDPSGPSPLTVELWSPPRNYLAHLLRP